MASAIDPLSSTPAGLHHEALFYERADGFLAGVIPFVEAGIAAGECVLVTLPSATRAQLEAELDDGAAARVRFAAMEELGRNPARIIPAWREFVGRGLAEGRAVRGVGEPVWPGRGEAELEECARHESLLNVAFAAAPRWSLLCPYDIASLPEPVLERARRTHPVVSRDGEAWASGCYRGSEAAAEIFAGELPAPPPDAVRLGFAPGQLRAVRGLVAAWSEANGAARDRAERLVLAVNELATNSIRHGGGAGTLRAWNEHDSLLCEVRDAGRFEQPLAGRRRPRPEQAGGRGLWIANQVCDLVQIRSDRGGSTVRLTIAL